MAITNLDIKFRQSQRMTDFDDGGGRMSAVEIIDNAMNNVFSDRSDLDGIIGRVSLRKLFLEVHTANTDPLLGPFVFLTEPPLDPNVSVCLFNTNSATDVRLGAQNYVQNYRSRGVKSQYILYGDHFAGQKTIQVNCRTEAASPDIGDVLCLSVEKAGYTPISQFVSVQEIALRTTVVFTDNSGDFQRDVLIIKLNFALLTDFPGQEDPQRLTGAASSPTVIRLTQVADAARYYGQKAVTVAPIIGDLVVNVGNPYIPIVPSTQAETPVVDVLAGLGTRSFIAASAAAALTFSGGVSAAAGAAVTRYLGTPYVPGSLAITVGSVALRDDGSGGVVAVAPDTDIGWSGSADYATGAFAIARDIGFSGTVSTTATAAGMILEQGYSRSITVTAANRDISYVFQLPGQPSPGTVIADYLALGKWIRLYDDGRGHLAGNPGQGSGTVNYATGSVALTLGALPDVDSAIIVAWGVDLRARKSSGDITIPAITFRQTLAHPGVVPASLTMTWKSGAVTKSATAASSGAITGDATGGIDISTGLVEFTTTFALDPGEQFHYAYTYVDPSKVHSEVFTPTAAGHAISINVAHAPVQAGSLVATWSNTVATGTLAQGPRAVRVTVRDDGTGGWLGTYTGTNTNNLTTGAITLTVDV